MALLRHELRQGRISLFIWTAAVAFMLSVCILIYPEMKNQMNAISGMFADMGGFSAAFGMDKLNFGEFSGFFGVECGNVLGLGGALFAALLGIQSLAREEKDGTAEFLLTHPVDRSWVLLSKLCAIFLQIVAFNIVVILFAALSIGVIGEGTDTGTLALLFFAYFLLQLETASVCFGISAWIRNGSVAAGLGIAILFYFLNILANLTKSARFLKYITPFGYTESADIISKGSLDIRYLAAGTGLAVLSVATGFLWYRKKDIES